jgi:hypothetical protein
MTGYGRMVYDNMGDKKEGKQTNHSTVARVDAARLHEYKFKTFKYGTSKKSKIQVSDGKNVWKKIKSDKFFG